MTDSSLSRFTDHEFGLACRRYKSVYLRHYPTPDEVDKESSPNVVNVQAWTTFAGIVWQRFSQGCWISWGGSCSRDSSFLVIRLMSGGNSQQLLWSTGSQSMAKMLVLGWLSLSSFKQPFTKSNSCNGIPSITGILDQVRNHDYVRLQECTHLLLNPDSRL